MKIKMTKKKVLTLSVATALIAIIAMGSLAWFTAEDSVTNNFYVGDTNTDADKVFGIDLWENRDVDFDGTYEDEEAEGLTYETILPGEKLSKEPHLENTGIHPQYVRAIVTVTGADILKAAMTPKDSEVSVWEDVKLFLAGTSEKWELAYKYYTNKDTFVFVYYYNEVLEAGAVTEQLFNAVVIPTELTKEQAAELGNFNIDILGQAIQSEHLADVSSAKEAFAKYWDEEGVVAGVVVDKDLAKADSTVSISYPITGNLGTLETAIVYDTDNYTDPDMPGVLMMSDATATVAEGASLVAIPTSESNATIYIKNADFTIKEGGLFIISPHGTGQIILENVTINGEKVTYSNLQNMIDNFVTGFTSSNFIIG